MAKTPQNNLNNVTQTLQNENAGQDSIHGVLKDILNNLAGPESLRSPRARFEEIKDIKEKKDVDKREKESAMSLSLFFNDFGVLFASILSLILEHTLFH